MPKFLQQSFKTHLIYLLSYIYFLIYCKHSANSYYWLYCRYCSSFYPFSKTNGNCISFMNNLLNTSHCVLPMQKDYHSTFGIILCHPITFLLCRNIYNIYNIIFITLNYLRVLYSQFLGLVKCLPYVKSIPCLCLALKFLPYVKSIPCLCYWHIM